MRATAISILYPTLAKLFLKNGGKADPKLKDVSYIHHYLLPKPHTF